MGTKEKRISVQIATKDRPSEVALLCQSLRTQTLQDWDLVILDDGQNNLRLNNFVMCVINRIKLENHYVNIIQEGLSLGVCHARNTLIEKDYFGNEYICRLDDDVIIQPDYLEKLMQVIEEGYDIASGVTPLIAHPEIKRNVKFVKPIINVKEFDKDGTMTKYGDDCGVGYVEDEIILGHEFRSNALMKKEVVKKIRYEKNLSPTGFREECFFSLRALWAGFKIGIHTQAIAYHINCPSGGVRAPDYMERVQSDDKYLRKWAKKMYKKNGKPTDYGTKKD